MKQKKINLFKPVEINTGDFLLNSLHIYVCVYICLSIYNFIRVKNIYKKKS